MPSSSNLLDEKSMPRTDRIVLRPKVVTQSSFELPSGPTKFTPSDGLQNHTTGSKRPRLVVVHGENLRVEYPLHEGVNLLGRTVDESVDIDLATQEPAHLTWTSRRHATIHLNNGQLHIEDLRSRNGTIINGSRLDRGGKRPLNRNDIIQIGAVRLRVII